MHPQRWQQGRVSAGRQAEVQVLVFKDQQQVQEDSRALADRLEALVLVHQASQAEVVDHQVSLRVGSPRHLVLLLHLAVVASRRGDQSPLSGVDKHHHRNSAASG